MKKRLISIAFGLLGCSALVSSFANELKEFPRSPCPFYVGLGGSWNTIDESFNSNLITSQQRSGQDSYKSSQSRLAPLLQIGYWRSFYQDWLWGAAVQWKYLYYVTPNDNATNGQHLPNATFSSINIFGPMVLRDFNSQTRANNEVLFLLNVGKELKNGSVYLGIGPALFTVSNSVYVSSIHTPNGTGDHLISKSVVSHKTVWGGAIQIGYNLDFDSSFFLNVNYTYSQTATSKFNNSVNTQIFNGFSVPRTTTLHLNRSIQLKTQEIMFSINKVFDI